MQDDVRLFKMMQGDVASCCHNYDALVHDDDAVVNNDVDDVQ